MGGVGGMLHALTDHYTSQSEMIKDIIQYVYLFSKL